MNEGVEGGWSSVGNWLLEQNRRFSLFQTGRLSRLELLRNYEISSLFPWGLILLIFLGSWAVGGDTNWQQMIGTSGFVIITIITIVVYVGAGLIGVFAAIQRFHDLGKSGWRTLLLLIPFAVLTYPTRETPKIFLGLKINPDGSFFEVYNGPGRYIKKLVVGRKEPYNRLHILSLKKLAEISSKIPAHEKVKTRKGKRPLTFPL